MVMTSGRINKSDIPNHSDLPEPFGQAKNNIKKKSIDYFNAIRIKLQPKNDWSNH
jgi:hypothetical protein